MSMVINTNLSSLTAQRHLASSRADMESAMERLSSGKRINSAMDDAAGLSISHSMNAQVTSMNQAIRNGNDGIAMINLAEGAMDQVSTMLNRMKELATQSANGTYNDSIDRDNLNEEFKALRNEISRIANSTEYNGTSVMGASASATDFQVGTGNSTNDRITATFQDMDTDQIGGGADTLVEAGKLAITTAATSAAEVSTQTLAAVITDGNSLTLEIEGTTLTQAFDSSAEVTMDKMAAQIAALDSVTSATVDAAFKVITITSAAAGTAITQGALKVVTPGGNISTQEINSVANARSALTNIDEAIKDVDTYRSDLGAVANRLEHTVGNLMTQSQHTSAAMSRIMDADYATESANLAKAQVLQQAGTAMLAQANASTQNVLSLLK